MTQGMIVDAPCPACRHVGVELRTTEADLPYFGPCLETVVLCPRCHFRHADFLILRQNEPTRVEFRAEGREDFGVRVVRSNSGTIRVPELGFTAEPTPGSEAFVSNVEGVLDRVRDVLLRARVFFGDDPERSHAAEERLALLDRLVESGGPVTVILDDPFGNCAILDERTQRRTLTPEEVEALETGLVILDKSDLDRLR